MSLWERKYESELEHHLAEQEDALVAEGWDREAARAEARKRLGNPRRIKRQLGDIAEGGKGRRWVVPSIGYFFRDIRFALRGLRKDVVFSVAIAVTLGLGLGATTAVHSVADAVMFRPLDFPHADRLVEVGARVGDLERYGMTGEQVEAWASGFSEMAEAYMVAARRPAGLVLEEGLQPLWTVAVTQGGEEFLGFSVLHGRGFLPEDDAPGAGPVVLLSEAFFDRLGGDPSLIGTELELDAGKPTIIGVLADGPKFPISTPRKTDILLLLKSDGTVLGEDASSAQQVPWIRLKPAVSLEVAREMAVAHERGLVEVNGGDQDWAVHMNPVGHDRANPDVSRALWVLLATVVGITVITLVNCVNLVLVRSDRRSKEMGVKAALGASRRRIVGQLLAEGLAIGLLGGVAAAGCAWLFHQLVAPSIPEAFLFQSPHFLDFGPRDGVMVFLLALGSGLVLGLAPGFGILASRIGDDARQGRSSLSKPQRRQNSLILVVQVAMSVVLLAAGSALARSYFRLIQSDPGFDADRVVELDLGLREVAYADAASRLEFAQLLLEGAKALPGVESVTAFNFMFAFGDSLVAEGYPMPSGQPHLMPLASVDPNYLATMGYELVEGRNFEAGESLESAIVDLDMAEFLWGRTNVLGERFGFSRSERRYTVVGVVSELRLMGRDQREGPYQFLRPRPVEVLDTYQEFGFRTGDPTALLTPLRRLVLDLDPFMNIYDLRTASDSLSEFESKPRFFAMLMSLLALLGVSIAVVGLYSVLAYSVSRRNKELGIRMSLGADHGSIRSTIIWEGLLWAAVGVTLGLGAFVPLGRWIEPLFYEVSVWDPMTFVSTATLFLTVAAIAALIPAIRATKVDPIQVLKSD